jgi:hypothetical protein
MVPFCLAKIGIITEKTKILAKMFMTWGRLYASSVLLFRENPDGNVKKNGKNLALRSDAIQKRQKGFRHQGRPLQGV